MTYQEECRLRAQMLLDAADGVEFQINFDGNGEWIDIPKPNFGGDLNCYRRKPKLVRHERVVVWYTLRESKAVLVGMYANDDAASRQMHIHIFRELKRETVFVEVDE